MRYDITSSLLSYPMQYLINYGLNLLNYQLILYFSVGFTLPKFNNYAQVSSVNYLQVIALFLRIKKVDLFFKQANFDFLFRYDSLIDLNHMLMEELLLVVERN